MKFRLILNLAVAALLVAATAEYNGRALGVVAALERDAYDFRMRRGAEVAEKQDAVVIVDIDRDSLRELGAWPWRRDRFVELSERLLGQYRVRMVAFAMPFSSPDDLALKTLEDARDKLGLRNNARLGEIMKNADYDGRFAAAVRGKPVALGYVFDESARAEAGLPRPSQLFSVDNPAKAADSRTVKRAAREWPFRRGYSGNRPELIRGALGAGHLTFFNDDDGLVRRAPLMVRHGGGYYESFPLLALRHYQNPEQPQAVQADPQEVGGGWRISEFQVSRFSAPVDEESALLINYRGAGGPKNYDEHPDAVFRYVSASEVIAGRAPVSHLEGKLAVVGSSSALLRDLHATPVNPAMPGAEVAAIQIANMLNGESLRPPPGGAFAETVGLLAAALLAAVAFVFVGPLISFVITAALCAGWVWMNLSQWEDNLTVYRFVPPLAVFAGLFVWSFIVGAIAQWRSSRRMQDTFGQYVPPELAKRMGKEKVSMEGESRVISVLFSDVRDFTSISEQYDPKDLALLMNRMLTALTAAIHKRGGTVDKYIGDAVMAFWNAPLDDPDHARNAALASLDMQEAMRKLSTELAAEGRAPMRLGVGICAGEASVGNMGSELRMAYTAMGDTVNLASRLEGLTKQYGAAVLVSDSVREMCEGHVVFRWIDDVRVKGREQPERIYEPLGDAALVSPEALRAAEVFHEMRRLYGEGDFAGSLRRLEKYEELSPGDPVAEVYRGRLAALISSPPAEWDGVTNFEEK